MVKEIDVRGQDVRQAVNSISPQIRFPFRVLRFRHDFGKSREQQALACLSSLPDFDRQSLLILNAVGGRDSVGMDALVVPRNCPDILPTKEEELYIAEGWIKRQPDKREAIPLVVETASGARQIAQRRFSRIFGVHRWSIEVDIRRVSREQMKEFARSQSEQGRSLPGFVQRLLKEL